MTIVKFILPKLIKKNIKIFILKMRSGRIVEEIVNPNPISAAMVEW